MQRKAAVCQVKSIHQDAGKTVSALQSSKINQAAEAKYCTSEMERQPLLRNSGIMHADLKKAMKPFTKLFNEKGSVAKYISVSVVMPLLVPKL